VVFGKSAGVMFKDGPATPVLVTVAVPAAKVEEVEN
jgi:hypothetical protein